MMVWGNLVAFVLLASTAALVEAKPTTSTSCYTVRVSGTRTLTSSLPPQTRRPTITTCPVVKSTVTVTRPRTSTNVVSSISTVRVTAAVTSITQTITPTVFTLTVPTITSQAPRFTPTETQILIAPSPGTFTSTTTTFTNPPGPTLAVAPPRRAVGDKAEDDGEIEERDGGCNDGEELVLDRRAGKNITPGNAQSEALRLKGKRVYCRRIVRLDPKTVAGTRTRTATIRTTVRPRTTVTSTVTATATSTVYNTAAGVFVTAAPTTSIIVAPAITVTSTSTAATVTTTSTVLTPQPTLVVPRLRNAFCGPLARPFNSNNFGVSDPTTQQLNFITPSAGQTCCDAAANIPGAVGYDNFNGVCAVVQISGTPTAQFCVAGNPATALVRDAICDATCSPGGLLQCGA
ncbi:unnamed protein product [Tilletia controversa]|uniref:WSC domain-containing protein n=3 Tax=Tilletia TaxID=13289 RepID=A0A8X7MUP4_9BASI|nr:hypothetical protein CF336_g4508 [Tilletia laevis]KAE8192704.1 hypothetical protein CF328_g5278 [Tilletia controversa]KAE8260573.1 hypothetical protein A4X03_0g3782 [Tilletia caries]KAE8201699.1 hypothetical protein CF335_g3685 [Tilletia laevis]KAE8249105.1 hypothetical protein A4X06_0g3384 [Tilletia controversa]